MYRIDIMTLFPESVGDVLCESILGRAQERDYLRIECWQIRDFTLNKQKQVDDYPYGGGRGAVMQADPLYRCWQHVCDTVGCRPHTIYLSPCGVTFNQEHARRLARDYENLLLVCGHYEGVDQRFLDACVDEEISLGDFVLTGGEIAAMAVADAVSRLIPGVLPDPACYENESHWNGLLEYPQYSRPEVWQGRAVPRELLCGDHGKVERWQRQQSLARTRARRPDLFAKLDLSGEDQRLLSELDRPPLPQPVECRPAREEDLGTLEAILAQAKKKLAPIGQWNDNYPARRDFLSDMARNECYVLTCGGEVGGFFTLSTLPEAGYAAITDGKWGADAPYAVVHRCAVASKWQGCGLSDRMAAEWKRLTRERGLGWVRVDTHKKNTSMRKLLQRCGFQLRGNVLVDDPHDPRRVAYDIPV